MPGEQVFKLRHQFGMGYSEQEQQYLAELDRIFRSSPYEVVERLLNFPLYVPWQKLAEFLVKYELFKRVLDVHGAVIEGGVMFGGGLLTFAHLSSILEPTNPQRKIIGFDNFGDTDVISEQDGAPSSTLPHADTSARDAYEEVLRCANLYDLNRVLHHISKIEVVRGNACETIPRYLEANPHLVVALLYLDFDYYAPTRTALRCFRGRMPRGAIIAFDELSVKRWPGETIAVFEELELRNLRVERLPRLGSSISFVQLS